MTTLVDARTTPAGCLVRRRRRPGRGGPVNRVRPVETLLAALATLAVTLPLTTLFTPPAAWFRPSVLARRPRRPRRDGAAPSHARHARSSSLGQAVLLVLRRGRCSTARDTSGATVVPTPETGRAVRHPAQQAYETVTNYTAPAPPTAARSSRSACSSALTALAVDAIGVTYRSPALAGIPLLVRLPGVGDQLR